MIATIILMIIFVACDAIQDVITFNFEYSVFRNFNPLYFNPNESWRNKYKYNNPAYGPKFFGSTTFLVWVTDFFHLLKFIKMNCIWIVVAVLSGILWLYLVGIIAHRIVFEIFYRAVK